jgi:hypothetical protein
MAYFSTCFAVCKDKIIKSRFLKDPLFVNLVKRRDFCPAAKVYKLRKVEDSNLRKNFFFTAFRVRPIRPLWQLSFLICYF